MGGDFFLAEFEVAEEAERVMRKGIRCFEDKTFHLERWGLEVGFLRPRVHPNHYWVRAVGLLLNFWN